MDLDIDSNSSSLIFYFPKSKTVEVKLKGILSFNYKPDFNDEPPWIVLDIDMEEISSVDGILEEETLFTKTSASIKDLKYPLYRVTAGSGDLSLKVVCQEVDVGKESNFA
ncbi:MAG: hypothetical protein HWE27_18655 [Gammaproteobacteria bacterium]|nr:hypothetical protein [Gammaproteobacteria bacterium]